MTESYWQTLNDQHPFFAPMIRHDGCKCLLIIDLLHETSASNKKLNKENLCSKIDFRKADAHLRQ